MNVAYDNRGRGNSPKLTAISSEFTVYLYIVLVSYFTIRNKSLWSYSNMSEQNSANIQHFFMCWGKGSFQPWIFYTVSIYTVLFFPYFLISFNRVKTGNLYSKQNKLYCMLININIFLLLWLIDYLNSIFVENLNIKLGIIFTWKITQDIYYDTVLIIYKTL